MVLVFALPYTHRGVEESHTVGPNDEESRFSGHFDYLAVQPYSLFLSRFLEASGEVGAALEAYDKASRVEGEYGSQGCQRYRLLVEGANE